MTSQRLVSINSNNNRKVPMDHARILWTREEVEEEIVATMKNPPRTELTVIQEARAKTAPMEKALLSFNGSNQRSRSRRKIPVRHEAEASRTREVRGEIATMGRSMTKITATMESARTMTMTATMEDHSINNTKTARGAGNKRGMRPRSKG
jgi:hypothetical protein